MPNSVKLRVERVTAADLTADTIEEIWRCYSCRVDRARPPFELMLRHGDEVFLCHDPTDGSLQGFKANKILTLDWEGRKTTVVFTSYASLGPASRGRNLSQRMFLRRFLALKARYPFRPLYWIFTASTYLSYLTLPRNFVEYWPSRHQSVSPRMTALLDLVMRHLAIDGWDPTSGVVKRSGSVRYREGVVADNLAVLADPDIRFYAERNPGQHRGDSLACVGRFDFKNCRRILVKMARRQWQQWWRADTERPRQIETAQVESRTAAILS